MDNDVRTAIAERLQSDATLLAMLPKNKNWRDQDDDDEQEKWSIVPLMKFDASNPFPQITIQMGGDNRVGNHLYETLIYIRCYNASDKTHVEITSVLARVQQLLDRAKLTLAGSTSIELRHDATQPEAVDQGYGDLPYRESRYRWQRV